MRSDRAIMPGWGLSPRRRGNHIPRNGQTSRSGLSPRRRGNLPQLVQANAVHGSIPAQAGEPSRLRCPSRAAEGLSPRRRGNRSGVDARRGGQSGSIPAQAGEPNHARRAPGGQGLSPRRRGNRRGSIPAQAGEPQSSREQGLSPRRRGNRELTEEPMQPSHTGLSPRRRGNPHAVRIDRVYPRAGGGTSRARSIPAQAGEPQPTCRPDAEPEVGSIPAQAGEPDPPRGLVRAGSIPAQAGEPHTERRFGHEDGVYPRAGGGTSTPRHDRLVA